MKSDRHAAVAIVGGGASGTILAAQLARRGLSSILVEGGGRVGKGVAYSTAEPAHLLNVRAEGMSAWAGEPDHFARHFEQEGGHPRGFAQRRQFARYLGQILEEAIATGKVEIVEGTAVGASRGEGGWRVRLESGEEISADALVLAIGNQEPEGLRAFASAGDRFIGNPWAGDAQAAIRELAQSGEPALIIGTGLTMVDLALSLDSAGYRGRLVAVSRRGLVPRGHADFDPAPVDAERLPRGSVGQILRWLRRRSVEVGWRAAVDSLRPHSHRLWQSLSTDEQRRFLRHARPWWDVHRHRIAPEVADNITRMIADERLRIMAGRIVSAKGVGNALEVGIRPRRSRETETMRFAYAFNCTGPLHAMSHSKDPLLRSLLDAGAVHADALDLGVGVDEHSRAKGGERLWALGPLTKGRYWEIIAVPDIREQAAAVADDLARELNA